MFANRRPSSGRQRQRRGDRGSADPILVLTSVTVSLILLVAGSFNIQAVAAKSQDKFARNDLSMLAAAEGTYFASQQVYVNYDSISNRAALAGDAIGFKPATHVAVLACGSGWVAAAKSLSGTVFTLSNTSATIGNAAASNITLPSCASASTVTTVVSYANGLQTPPSCAVTPTPTVGLAGTVTSATQAAFTITANANGNGQPAAPGWAFSNGTASAGTAVSNVNLWVDGVESCGVATATFQETGGAGSSPVTVTLNLSSLDAATFTRFKASGRIQFDYAGLPANTVRL